MIQVNVHENYRTFDDPDEITYETNFTCTICNELSQNYIDIDNILICKGCLSNGIELLNKKLLDHIKRKGEVVRSN